MKLLAISDHYIPAVYMQRGLEMLAAQDIEIEVRPWEHAKLIDLQQANLAIEQHGPAAVELPESLLSGVEEFAILVVQFAPVGRMLLERAGQLKVIGVLRGGLENVDVECATQRRITILNTPGRNARAVAECTLGLMLSEVRNIARAHAALHCGLWQREFPNSAAIPELYGKTVGLVGLGAIGQLVAHYLQAFGSDVLAYDPYYQGETGCVQLVELDELLRVSDIVSLHARLTPESHHLLGAEQFALMKPTAVLINTARSGLVDEQALASALARREIMGAAIDVFDQEPLPADHPLLTLDNVTLTPHLAGSTVDAFRGSPRLMAEHLTRYFQGNAGVPIVNGVDLR